MSESKFRVVLVNLNSSPVHFSYDYLWEVDSDGNLMIVKEYGTDWKIATFACGEWQYVMRIEKND